MSRFNFPALTCFKTTRLILHFLGKIKKKVDFLDFLMHFLLRVKNFLIFNVTSFRRFNPEKPVIFSGLYNLQKNASANTSAYLSGAALNSIKKIGWKSP